MRFRCFAFEFKATFRPIPSAFNDTFRCGARFRFGMVGVHVGVLAATGENLNWPVHMFSQVFSLRSNMAASLPRKRLTTHV